MKKITLVLTFIVVVMLIAISATRAFARPKYYSVYRYYYGLAKNALKGSVEDLDILKKNATKGNSFAQAELGFYYTKKKNFSSGLYGNRKAAANNNYVAENSLGNYYYWGSGVNKDYSKSLYWFKKSAIQGFANAESNLGSFYLRGLGVINQNYTQAIYWIKKSAMQGFYYGEYSLGFIYLHGKGVPIEYNHARYWFEKAAQKGFKLADVDLALIYTKGLGVNRNYKKAFYYSKKSGFYKVCYYSAINYMIMKYYITESAARPKAAYECRGLRNNVKY
jgi:hypothetical protein